MRHFFSEAVFLHLRETLFGVQLDWSLITRENRQKLLIGQFLADLQRYWLAADSAVIKPPPGPASLQLCAVFYAESYRQYRVEL